jgi:hypothetical protein
MSREALAASLFAVAYLSDEPTTRFTTLKNASGLKGFLMNSKSTIGRLVVCGDGKPDIKITVMLGNAFRTA